MELGLNFDDGDLVEEQKEKPVLISYNAKICESKWFLNELPSDGDDVATLWKTRADYHYSDGDYDSAIEGYHQCLETLDSHNRTMRREAVEALARCYSKTGDHAKALENSDKLIADCLTSAHYCQAWLLQRQIHHLMGNIQEEIGILHQLIQLHSFHAPFWNMLAQAYNTLYLRNQTKPDVSSQDKKHQPCCDIKKIEEPCVHTSDCHGENAVKDEVEFKEMRDAVEELERTDKEPVSREMEDIEETRNNCNYDVFSEYPCDLIRLTCFVRLKLMMRCYMRNTGSFVKERNQETYKKIEQDIQALSLNQHLIDTVTEFIRNDISEDDDVDDAQSKEDTGSKSGTNTQVSAEDFHKRWFAWIKQL